MAVKSRWVGTAALLTVAFLAFFTGRGIEQSALAARAHLNSRFSASASPSASIQPGPPAHQQLAVAEIVALPFAEFYEALRSAAGEARKKWALELAQMPEGPRRTAAVSGFYKLLVQFDPEAAAKAITEIGDKRMQECALGSAVKAAPGFAMPLMAKISLSLQDGMVERRDYLAEIMEEWMLIDPSAAAHFIDDHTEAFEDVNHSRRFFTPGHVVSAWAAVDPKATKDWIDRKEKWDYSNNTYEDLVEGWYENDPAAAVSYTLAHVDEARMSGAIGAIVRSLYSESREEATKFVESLPLNKRTEALSDAFRNIILGVEEETGDTILTQRAIASWMIEFPPDYWRGTLASLFAVTRPGADDMLSWIQQLSPALQQVVAAEYSPPSWKPPSEAIMGVMQVLDPTLRDKLLKAALNNSSGTGDDFRAAVETLPISSEQKNHVLQIILTAEAEKESESGQ